MTYKLQKTFSAAHFYKQDQWSADKNQEEFGKCFTTYGHGHDYILETAISSSNLQETIAVVESVIQELDHQHLNFTIAEFKNKIPTTENIALYIQKTLIQKFTDLRMADSIHSLKLQEAPGIWVELGQS